MKRLLGVCLVLGSALGASAADVDVNLGTLPPGKTVTIRFRATVNGPLPAGIETVQNQGSVSGTNLSTVFTDDPDTGAPGDATATMVLAMPDMAITKTDGVTAAVPGGTLTYSLLVSNVGNQDATGVELVETVPMGTTFDATNSSPGWLCPHGSPGNTSCSLVLGPVGVGAGIVRTFAVVVDNPPPPGQGSIVNTAIVFDDGLNGPDPNSSNNQATDTDGLGTDLQMALADAPDPVTPGNALTYTLTATNAGPGIADAATVSHTLPPGTVFVSLASAPGWSCTTPAVGSAGVVSCTIPTFPIVSAVFTLVVGVDPGVEDGTVIAASATVASSTTEINAANNTGNASTTVQEATTAPVRPTQVSPTGTIGTASPTYVWNVVPGAEEYSIWIGTSTTNLLTGPTWIPAYAAGCGATTCSFTPTLILSNGSYQWWVQARNDVGMGQWGTGLSFTVAVALPGPTTPLAPSGLVTSTANPTYQWTPSAGATQYDLYVNNTAGAILINTTIAAPACAPTCSATGIALPDGSYELWVRGKNTGGGGPWGGPLAFTIDAQPNPPTLIAPTGTVTTPRPVFLWNAVAGAVDYQLYVTDATNGVLLVWYPAASVCAGATCSVQPSTNLQEGPHQFWVRVRDTAGTSPWSTPLSFLVTKPGKPVLIGPSGTTSDPTPTYQWQESAGATEYQLWVESPTNSVVIQAWYDAATACSGGTCSATPTASLYNGVNRFWVKARSCSGSSDWSNEMVFTETGGTPLPAPAVITAAPTGAAPTGTITTNTTTFTWNDVPNALDYQLVVSNGGGAVYTRRFSGLGVCSGGTCSVTPPETFADGAYTWTVQSQNQVGNGPMSAPVAFTVAVGNMISTLQTPTGPAGSNTPLFTWDAAPEATEYYLWLSGPGGVYTSWFASSDVCVGATCSVNPGNVLPPGTHRWWILPRNCTAIGSWSVPLTFLVP